MSNRNVAISQFLFPLCLVTVAVLFASHVSAQETPSAEAPSEASNAQPTDETPPGETTAPPAESAEGNSETPAVSETPQPEEPPKEIPFKSLPYSVHVGLGFQSRCLPDQEDRDRVLQSVKYALSRMYGRMWQVDVEFNEWLSPADQRRLSWLVDDDMLPRVSEEEYHKAFIVTIESDGPSFVISAREYDSRIQELTPIYSRNTLDVRSIASITSQLLRDTFRPCVLYERGYQNEEGRPLMEMQVQAGELLPPDPSAEQVTENDVLRPFVRQMDRRNPLKLSKLLRLDLSYVRVMEVDRENAPGRIQGFFITHSPFSPFGSKGRRIQHFAVRQRPAAEESSVRIVLRGRPDKPLVSHRLAIAYQLDWKDPEDGPQTQLVSDRDGEVVIQRREGHPTFWLRVYSGRSLLARVPYAPGLIPSDLIELPDDSIRLSVEGEIQLLADELVDSIALGAVLMARARKSAEGGDTAQFEAILDRMGRVPGREYFLDKISNVKIPAVKEADARRLSTRKIRELCESLESSVNNFFKEDRVRERQIELEQLKVVAAQKAAAN